MKILCGTFILFLSSCASKLDYTVAVRDFSFSQNATTKDEWNRSDYGEQLRVLVEQKLVKHKGVKIVARKKTDKDFAQEEIIESRNKDAIFTSKKKQKKLEEGFVADKVITGSCQRAVENKERSVWQVWEYPLFFIAWTWNFMEDPEEYSEELLRCTYRVQNVETNQLELSGSVSREYSGVKELNKSLEAISKDISNEIIKHYR